MTLPAQPTDSFTKTGAERLARTIRDFWVSKGHTVTTRVVPLQTAAAGFDNAFVIKSNLVNGKPRRGKTIISERMDGTVEFFSDAPTLRPVPPALDVFRL